MRTLLFEAGVYFAKTHEDDIRYIYRNYYPEDGVETRQFFLELETQVLRQLDTDTEQSDIPLYLSLPAEATILRDLRDRDSRFLDGIVSEAESWEDLEFYHTRDADEETMLDNKYRLEAIQNA